MSNHFVEAIRILECEGIPAAETKHKTKDSRSAKTKTLLINLSRKMPPGYPDSTKYIESDRSFA